jgi:hypothetical protein
MMNFLESMLSKDNSSEKPSCASEKLRNMRSFAFSNKQESAPVKLEEGASRFLRRIICASAFSH